MGFAAADVVAGVAAVLAAHGVDARTDSDGERWTFRCAGDVEIAVGPLPADRYSTALFHPRCLLVVRGDGALADRLRDAIRVKFLRVTG